jgi:hypothetical protein
MALPPRIVLAAVLALGCAATASPDTLYQKGMDAFRGGQAEAATESLDGFVGKACRPPRPDRRCREAYLTLARAHEKRGAPGGAWAAYDAALGFGPHDDDAQVTSDRDRNQHELVERNGKAAARSPVIVRYRDEVSDEYNARSVVISLDFDPVLTKDHDANELHSPDFRKVFGGSVPAGEHVLVVETIHDCKPSGGVPCARSHVRKAWPFTSAAHTPTTIEIRAYAEDGTADSPARPAIELVSR